MSNVSPYSSERPVGTRYLFAVGMAALAACLRFAATPWVHTGIPFGFFLPAILIAGLYGGYGPAAVASALGCTIGLLIASPQGPFIAPVDNLPQATITYVVLSAILVSLSGNQYKAVQKSKSAVLAAKRSQEELRSTNDLALKRMVELEIIYEQCPVALCFVDPELRFIRINQRMAEINRLSIEEHLGKTAHELFGHVADGVAEICRSVLQSRTPLHGQVIEMEVDGEPRSFIGNYDPVFAEDGKALGVNIVVEETTELHRARVREKLLAQAATALNSSLDYKDTLSQICDSVVPMFGDWCSVIVLEDNKFQQIAVKHIDPDKVRWAKELHEKYPPDAEALTGVPAVIRTGRSELIREITPEMIAAANLDDERLQIVEELCLSSLMIVPIAVREKVLGALTLVWAESNRRYSDEDLQTAEELGRRAGIAIDNALLYAAAQKEIAERAAAEEQVRTLNADLEQRVSERTAELRAAMDELEGFCYSVSHDLRAPMRSLSGNSRMLIEDFGGELSQGGKEHLRRINLAATKMGELVDDLLQFSRLGRAHFNFRSVDLSELAESAAASYKAQNPSDAEVVIQPNIIACGDPNVLALAIQNLMDNALKYSSKVKAPRVEFGSMKKDGETVYFVRDNGVGFDMNYAAQIFQPFVRLHGDAEYPGTGIGLANVQRVIMRHGGTIWAESEIGRGATFYFTLKARSGAESAPLTVSAPSFLR